MLTVIEWRIFDTPLRLFQPNPPTTAREPETCILELRLFNEMREGKTALVTDDRVKFKSHTLSHRVIKKFTLFSASC